MALMTKKGNLMARKASKKKNLGDTLHVFIVDLRDFMLARDENTLFTERELAAKMVNDMILSLTFQDESEHKHIALLGLRGDGVSHEGCQDELVSTAAIYQRNVKGSNIREFSYNDGLVKMNFPFWLQAPFEGGRIITSDSSHEALSLYEVVFGIISKWKNRPIDLLLLTKKDSAPDLDAFKKFATYLKMNGFTQLGWGILDTSEWRVFDPIAHHFISLETVPITKKRKGK